MTTYEGIPGPLTYFTMLVAKMASRSARRREASPGIARTWFQSIVKLMLNLAGFSCLTYGMFTWSTLAGFVTAAISFFVLSWLMSSTQPTGDSPQPPTLR